MWQGNGCGSIAGNVAGKWRCGSIAGNVVRKWGCGSIAGTQGVRVSGEYECGRAMGVAV